MQALWHAWYGLLLLKSCKTASLCDCIVVSVWLPSKATNTWPHTGGYLGFYLFYIPFGETEQVSESYRGLLGILPVLHTLWGNRASE